MSPQIDIDRLPQKVQRELKKVNREVDQVILNTFPESPFTPEDRIAFHFSGVSSNDVLTDNERAQSISFIIHFENLPSDYPVKFQVTDGKCHISNIGNLRAALNEFRPLLQNQKDLIHYQRVHNDWCKMLRRTNPQEGTCIRVIDIMNNDVTQKYIAHLNAHRQAISVTLGKLEFGFLYNGILQHSDKKYSKRFLDEYTSGKLDYVLLKHYYTLPYFRDCLSPYYDLLKMLTSPQRGHL